MGAARRAAAQPARRRLPYSSRPTFAGTPGHALELLAARPRARPRASRSARSSARLRAGPMPGSSSSSELVIALSRRVRWWVIGEAVRLVAHALQQLQLGRGVVEHERGAAARDEQLLDPLGQRDHAHAPLAEAAQRRRARRRAGPCRRRSRPGSAARRSSRRRPGRAARCPAGAPTGRSAARAPPPSPRSRRRSPQRACGS